MPAAYLPGRRATIAGLHAASNRWEETENAKCKTGNAKLKMKSPVGRPFCILHCMFCILHCMGISHFPLVPRPPGNAIPAGTAQKLPCLSLLCQRIW
jgi:hypothetical protein